ncbi:hypothetical protein XENTR_v10004085 [Xenopus tropicalis]|nr:hypothetical protein XENTR_v10004085 [Xenopus tropicalis]
MKGVSTPSQLEVCPFCGKPFKRLKTHLPHCKLAKADKKTVAAESQLTGKKTKQQKNVLLESSQKKNKSKTGRTGELGKLLQENSGPSTLPKEWSTATKRKKPNLQPKEQQQQVSLTIETEQKRHLSADQELISDSDIQHLGTVTIFGTNSSLSSVKECFERDQNPHSIMKVKLSKEAEAKNHRAMPAKLSSGILKDSDTKWNASGSTGAQHIGHTDIGHQTHGAADRRKLSELPVSKGATTEWSKGESLATGRKEVWDHINHSLGRLYWYEQEQSASAAFQLPSPCVPFGTLALKSAKSLSATSTLKSVQNSVISHEVICNIQPMEINRQLLKTSSGPVLQQEASLTRSVVSACPLGLQWFPELYPNYISLRFILGRQSHGNIEWNTNTIDAPKGADHDTPLALRNVMDVRMREFPLWIANHFSIRTLPGAVQKAWGQYYSKYINVKKGGIGGLTMLLAGYCILSYTWNYDHISMSCLIFL